MRRSSLLALLLALAAPASVAAQAPEPLHPRTGFWISIGLGGGGQWLSCDLCTDEFGSGFGSSIALGGTVNQQWTIGADIIGFFPFAGLDEGYDDDSDGFGAALFTAHFYPRAERGLFLVGGMGLGQVDVEQDQLEARGFVGKVGLGYDLRAGRNFSFTPNVSLVQTFSTETERLGDVVDSSLNFGMLQVSVAVTWH